MNDEFQFVFERSFKVKQVSEKKTEVIDIIYERNKNLLTMRENFVT